MARKFAYQHRRTPYRRAAMFVVAALLCSVTPAAAQSAASLYEDAQRHERDVLVASPLSPDSLRRVAREYESLVRRYPTSGYADNALLQAGGLVQRAFETGGDVRDKSAAIRYFAWLQKEYPHSSLARQASDRAASLESAAGGMASPPAPVARAETGGTS